MPRLPRLALATPAHGSEPTLASLAVLAGLASAGWRVQHFRAKARPFGSAAVDQLTGLPERHLDDWLMPPDVCRAVFLRGTRNADIAVVEGTLEPVDRGPEHFPFDRPGPLAPLIEALDLPTVAVVPCRTLAELHLPSLPSAFQGILLDGLERPEEYEPIRRLVEAVARKPVLGAIDALPLARCVLDGMAPDEPIPEPLIAALRSSFLRFADLNAWRALAEGRPFETTDSAEQRPPVGSRFRVAYAQDEAFGGYYPDTLEMLEMMGAELVEFSPLRSGDLPRGIDLVMIGCGFPERHAVDLEANVSLVAALHCHLCDGRRIYTEGGGTIYLGRTFTVAGRTHRGAGIFPFDATLRDQPRGPTPVTRTLSRSSWIGPAGATVRGYRCSRWSLCPAPDPDVCRTQSGTLTPQRDIHFRHHAIGSLIHLHLGALPQVVESFVGPHRPSLWLPNRTRP